MGARPRITRLRAATLGTVFGIVIGTSAVVTLIPSAPGGPVASSPSATARHAPSLLMGRRVVIGGTTMASVVTDAIDAFEIVGPDGSSRGFPLSGVAIGTPSFDGEDRLAYWSRQSVDGGEYRLAIWSAATHDARVIFEEPGVLPGGAPVWTADGRAVIVGVRRDCVGPTRVFRVNVDGSGAVMLTGAPALIGLNAIYFDDDIILIDRLQAVSVPPRSTCAASVGSPVGSYAVLDARTGAVRKVVAHAPSARELHVSRSGVVAELTLHFESASHPLRVFAAAQPDVDLVSYDDPRGITSPYFWPGRTELVFTQDGGITALDYTSSSLRSFAVPVPGAVVAGFDPTGQSLMLRTDAGYAVAERSGDDLHLRADVSYKLAGSPSLLGVLR